MVSRSYDMEDDIMSETESYPPRSSPKSKSKSKSKSSKSKSSKSSKSKRKSSHHSSSHHHHHAEERILPPNFHNNSNDDDDDDDDEETYNFSQSERRDEDMETATYTSYIVQNESCNICDAISMLIGPTDVVLKLLAFTTPNSIPVALDTASEEVPLPDTPGFICVGRIMSNPPRNSGLDVNDTVMAILPSHGKCELYTKIPYSKLMKVPSNIDPFILVALVLTYVPALQALQTAPFTVEGKRVMINGGVGPVAQALIHLSRIHGAKRIYVPAQKQYKHLIKSMGAKLLGPSHLDWGRDMMGEMDVVVDSIGENNFATSRFALKKKGHLVKIGNAHLMANTNGTMSLYKSMESAIVDMRLKSNSKTSIYGLMSTWEADRDSFEQDLIYVMVLYSKGEIRPIANRLNLQQYRENPVSSVSKGVAICDPWKETPTRVSFGADVM